MIQKNSKEFANSQLVSTVKNAWIALSQQVYDPCVIIASESDLKCHLFRILYEQILHSGLPYIIVTEKNYATSGKKVDLYILDRETGAEVLVELKNPARSKKDPSDIERLKKNHALMPRAQTGFVLSTELAAYSRELTFTEVEMEDGFVVIQSAIKIPLEDAYLLPFAKEVRGKIQAFFQRVLDADPTIKFRPVKPDEKTNYTPAFSVKRGRQVLFYILLDKLTQFTPTGKPTFQCYCGYPETPFPDLTGIVPPSRATGSNHQAFTGSFDIEEDLEILARLIHHLK